jgi:hypothetical protein
MIATLTRMIRSTSLTLFLLVFGVICLVIHFEIYRRTSASAFINHPELYFRNVFVIRDANGQDIREVSYAVGFSSYITAFITVVAFGWSIAHIILKKRQ